MSQIAGGAILMIGLLPLLAVAGAIGLAVLTRALAGTGVIIVQETGQMLVACGRDLVAVVAENRQLQRNLQAAAIRYEQELVALEAQSSQDQVRAVSARRAATTAQQQQRHAETVALRERLRQPAAPVATMQETTDRLRAAVLASEPPPSAPQYMSSRWWRKKIEAAQELADSLAVTLRTLATGYHAGLVDVSFLDTLLTECQQQLAPLVRQTRDSAQSSPPDTLALDRLSTSLAFLDRRVTETVAQLPERQRQRDEAEEAIQEALAQLDQSLGTPPSDSGADDAAGSSKRAAGLQIAGETIDDALVAFNQGEFLLATSSARAAIGHLEALSTVVADQRRQNLRHYLGELHERVEAIGGIPELASAAQHWLALEQECLTLADRDIAAAWARCTDPADGLADGADDLQKQALAWLQQTSATALATQARQALEAMGYAVERQADRAGLTSLVGRNGKRRADVAFTTTGEARVEFSGFGDASCRAAQQEFFERLQAAGIKGAWQSRFTLTSAVQQLVHTLHGAGLTVEVESSPEGATVLASGRLKAEVAIDYDGRYAADALPTDLAAEAARQTALQKDQERKLQEDEKKQREEWVRARRRDAQQRELAIRMEQQARLVAGT